MGKRSLPVPEVPAWARVNCVYPCHPATKTPMENSAPTSLSPGSQSEQSQLGPAARRMGAVGCVFAVIGMFAIMTLMGGESPLWFSVFSYAYLGRLYVLSLDRARRIVLCDAPPFGRAGWSVTLRRLAEAVSGNIGLRAGCFSGCSFSNGTAMGGYPNRRSRCTPIKG